MPRDREQEDPLAKANRLLGKSAKAEPVRPAAHHSGWHRWLSRRWQSATDGEESQTQSAPVDPLLERVHKTQETARRLAKAAKQRMERSPSYQAHKQAVDVMIGFSHAVQAGVWIYKTLLQPVVSVCSPLARGVWGKYRKIWNWVVYTTNSEGEREFVKKRAVAMALVTVLAATQIPEMLNSTWQCALWVATRRTEKMYMNQSEEPSNSFHSAKGCHELPCTPENSRYYQISDSYFHDLRDVLLRGHRYYPDLVAAGIPAVTSECTVTSYGFRQKFFSGFKQMWPILLEAQCQPLSMPEGTPPAQASDSVGTQHAPSPVVPHPPSALPTP